MRSRVGGRIKRTSVASTIMRAALPIGFPKLIVSTIASGNTTDINWRVRYQLMYSVVMSQA